MLKKSTDDTSYRHNLAIIGILAACPLINIISKKRRCYVDIS